MLRRTIAGLGIITCILIFSRKTDYSFNGVDVYSTLKSLTDSLEENNITYFLGSGSALGAARRGGIIKGDKDVDIHISGSAPFEIEAALWGFDWDYTDFGYHVHLKKTNFYFDIWVLQEKYGKLICVGANGKCHLWEQKYNWPVVVPVNIALPPRLHIFGGKQFYFPNDLFGYLDHEYPDWQNNCGGWRIGTRPCKVDDFV